MLVGVQLLKRRRWIMVRMSQSRFWGYGRVQYCFQSRVERVRWLVADIRCHMRPGSSMRSVQSSQAPRGRAAKIECLRRPHVILNFTLSPPQDSASTNPLHVRLRTHRFLRKLVLRVTHGELSFAYNLRHDHTSVPRDPSHPSTASSTRPPTWRRKESSRSRRRPSLRSRIRLLV